MEKGYVHVYTGNGKGKTTAALGLSLRAVCAGKKVYFAQFIKGMEYSELKAADLLENFTLKQYGRDCFIFNKPTEEDKEMAKEGLAELRVILREGKFDVVVLDEINIALYYKLFDAEDVMDMIKNRKENVEVILTGRNALESIIEFADLVSEINEVKHYYQQGVQARIGIEK